MNKLIITLAVILMASSAQAQSRRSLNDIDKELKQTKSTATAMALIESIADTTPQTDEDVSTLGRLMDKYPTQGQKAFAGIKDPKLAKAVMTECGRQVAKFKADKDKDWKALPEAQRHERFNALLNTHAMIATLGNMKNKEALPLLKQYISPEYDGTLSYDASQAIGRIAPDDPTVFKELWDKPGVKNISYSAYGKSVLKEVAEKMQDPNVSQEEKHRMLAKSRVSLLSGKDPDEKKLLKDIVLNHPNKEFRYESAIAMVHAVLNKPESTDKEFLLNWVKNEKSDAVVWAPDMIDKAWDKDFLPVLLGLLQNSLYSTARSASAGILGRRQIKESLPYLETCIEKDKDSTVRGTCRGSYYRITGKIPIIFHPDDVKAFEAQHAAPYSIKFYSSLKENDPDKIYFNAIINALNEYRKTHPDKVGGK